MIDHELDSDNYTSAFFDWINCDDDGVPFEHFLNLYKSRNFIFSTAADICSRLSDKLGYTITFTTDCNAGIVRFSCSSNPPPIPEYHVNLTDVGDLRSIERDMLAYFRRWYGHNYCPSDDTMDVSVKSAFN